MLASGGLTRNKNNLSPTRRRVGGVGHHHSTGRYVTLKWYVESAQGKLAISALRRPDSFEQLR
jgi:hypothetical protein